MGFKATQQGITSIRQAMKNFGWAWRDTAPLVEASKVIEPNGDWQPDGLYAEGCSESTWRRFLEGKTPINPRVFKTFCQILGLDWQNVAQRDVTATPEEFYIPRPPIEAICYETLLQPGSLLRIKAAKQMGKTSLMVRLFQQAENLGYRTVLLNFLRADRDVFKNLDTFLRWFCASISRRLQQSNQVDEHWDKDLGSNLSCTAYFEEYFLDNINSPLVLALDNVERVFPYQDLAPDFFGLLRAWHEDAKINDIWKNLRLVVAYSTEVYIKMPVNISPFSVGKQIVLPDFTPTQVKELATLHNLDWNDTQIEQLMEMVGGHPWLVLQPMSYLTNDNNTTLEEILQTAGTASGIYSNHLREHFSVLQQHPELASAMKKLVNDISALRLEPMLLYRLQSLGLVQLSGNYVKPRCELYRQYFRDSLGGGVTK